MRIHLVDDEQIVITTLRDFLVDIGHEVVIAHSAGEALENPPPGPVDLIITDLYMPNKSGMEMIREVHRHYPETPIVVITGYGPVFSLQEAIAQGVYAYLRKPIHLSELELLLVRMSRERVKKKGCEL